MSGALAPQTRRTLCAPGGRDTAASRGVALRLAAALAMASAGSGTGWAQDVEAGRVRAQQQCAVCHGPQGISSAPDAPHLAGQPQMYLMTQLRAYRAGTRRHEVMGVIARQLSDEDIQAVSAWYAAIRIEATPPR